MSATRSVVVWLWLVCLRALAAPIEREPESGELALRRRLALRLEANRRKTTAAHRPGMSLGGLRRERETGELVHTPNRPRPSTLEVGATWAGSGGQIEEWPIEVRVRRRG